jgi:hypothetical protein
MTKSPEAALQAEIQISLPHTVTIFRNNTGSLQDANGRRVDFGLCKGSSDLIGWTEIEITPAMVGKKVAVFTAIEVKQFGWKPSGQKQKEHFERQLNFINQVKQSGGYAGVAYSIDDALKTVTEL